MSRFFFQLFALSTRDELETQKMSLDWPNITYRPKESVYMGDSHFNQVRAHDLNSDSEDLFKRILGFPFKY